MFRRVAVAVKPAASARRAVLAPRLAAALIALCVGAAGTGNSLATPAGALRNPPGTAATGGVGSAAYNATRALHPGDSTFLAAREAFQNGDLDRLNAHAARLGPHVLASYVELWQLTLRLRNDDPARIDAAVRAFFDRHAGTYVADRLRMEWLQALARRGEWATFITEQKLQVWQHDNPQTRCWLALARIRSAEGVAPDALLTEARRTLASTREAGGEACVALTLAILPDPRLPPDWGWTRVRGLVEHNQLAAARRVAGLLPRLSPAEAAQAIDKPAQWLAAHERRATAAQSELALVALAQLARDKPDEAARFATQMGVHFTPTQRAKAWGRIGHMAAIKLMPEALDWYRRGGERVGTEPDAARNDEVLEWLVRAALRGTRQGPDWATVRSAIERMSPEQQADAAWIYWRARALQAEGRADEATSLLRTIAGRHEFYGKLAAEDLGVAVALPPRAPAPAAAEVAAFADNAGLQRAQRFYKMLLRADGNREWNWQTRGLDDRQLLAMAEYARGLDRIDRMISTSDRTREQFDFTQRFPTPFRDQLRGHAKQAGLDETWIYGLIRQESRFILDLRSSAGAQGLMQLMPATARYVARRVGLDEFRPERVNEVDINLRLGTSYLKMVLDDLDGHPALASAAYNAGPGRPRLWRSTLLRPVEGAIFAETIPFNETRDYVKKVMSNSIYYAALLDGRAPSLKARLGTVAPKNAGATELP